jgi:hypothetical protein
VAEPRSGQEERAEGHGFCDRLATWNEEALGHREGRSEIHAKNLRKTPRRTFCASRIVLPSSGGDLALPAPQPFHVSGRL